MNNTITLSLKSGTIDLFAKVKESGLPYELTITARKTDGFMPFLRALTWSEMQTASSGIWTCNANSISYDSYHYAKHAS